MHRRGAETREHVLGIAQNLFYWQGIRATGIDRVASEAGVAPTTLYRLFSSKDELIAAYVARADAETREWFCAAIDRAGPDPRAQILSVFDETLARAQPDLCRGCAFLMTLAEFPDPDVAAHRLAVEAKTWVRQRLGELTARFAQVAPVADHMALADRLALVFDGISASTQSMGIDGPARQARALVEAILDSAAVPAEI